MCGIAGVFTSSGLSADELERAVGRMAAIQAHRGPDDSGNWNDAAAGVAFGFRRLAILDLSAAGHQPMLSSSGRFVAMFNGEVYNHQELRELLRPLGYNFRGRSDTEVILAAVEEWGIRKAVERFVGMFAIALWDNAERRLTLVRDRLGIKPLFVMHAPGTVAFASELKAIALAPGFARRFDQTAVAEYLRYLYVPAPRTMFESVDKLRPGHLIEIVDPGKPLPESEPFWSLETVTLAAEDEPVFGSDLEVTDALDRLLQEAVGLRMVADVPVGALLSGGVDSSIVVALMQATSSRPVRTYTVGFDAVEYDESTQAAAVAHAIGTDHTELRVAATDALDLVPNMPATFDEPNADPSLLPTYLVCRLARKAVTVALSGDGGDEVFGGYNRYIHGRWMIPALDRVPPGLRRAAFHGWRKLGSDAAPIRSWRGRAGKIAQLLAAGSGADMYRSLHSAWLDPREIVPGAVDAPGPFAEALAAARPRDFLARMQLADQRTYLPDDLLAKVDRASMAVSLEARVPLLDHRVVEFGWRLPRKMKIRGRQGKWILRQVLDRYLPRRLVERPKMGFTVPLESWLHGPLRDWGDDLLHSRAMDDLGFIDAVAARRAWSHFQDGRGYRALALWALLVLVSWASRSDNEIVA